MRKRKKQRQKKRCVKMPSVTGSSIVELFLTHKLFIVQDGRDLVCALLFTLKALIDFHQIHPVKTVRENIHIGFIKETKQYGNTSVSMGAAHELLVDGEKALFLNCGTGGIKFQLFERVYGRLKIVAESKMTKSQYHPNQHKLISEWRGVTKQDLQKQNTDLINTLDEVKQEPDFLKHRLINVPVYAFITGTIRKEYDDAVTAKSSTEPQVSKQATEDVKMLDEKMLGFFSNVASPLEIATTTYDGSYFMSQTEEGKLELSGCVTLYDSLRTAGQIHPNCRVVSSLGVGNGSAQWCFENALFSTSVGMKDTFEQLRDVEHKNIREQIDVYPIQQRHEDEISIIALKSGALLWLEKNPDLLDFLTGSVTTYIPQPVPCVDFSVTDQFQKLMIESKNFETMFKQGEKNRREEFVAIVNGMKKTHELFEELNKKLDAMHTQSLQTIDAYFQ